MSQIISNISLWLLPALIVLVLTIGILKRVPVYEEFTKGAKEGFGISVRIIPYLVAIIVGVAMFRASGAIDIIEKCCMGLLIKFHVPSDVLPLMIVRSLSGSGALGIFSDIANHLGPNSYATKLAAVMVGSSETTFYVLAVYFGSVGISKIKYAAIIGIIADIIGIVASVYVVNYMFSG